MRKQPTELHLSKTLSAKVANKSSAVGDILSAYGCLASKACSAISNTLQNAELQSKSDENTSSFRTVVFRCRIAVEMSKIIPNRDFRFFFDFFATSAMKMAAGNNGEVLLFSEPIRSINLQKYTTNSSLLTTQR